MSLQLQVDRLVSVPASGGLKLQLGCGTNLLDGWINTDSMPSPVNDYLDFSRRFPFNDGTIAAVFCEHTIEHVSLAEARHMVGEVFRVLRPGGVFRVVTPCLENFCRMVTEPESGTTQSYLAWFRRYANDQAATIADAINRIFYDHGHRHIYSQGQLAALLTGCGFNDARVMPAGSCHHAVFAGADGHGKVIGEAINAIEAMAIEAVKPA